MNKIFKLFIVLLIGNTFYVYSADKKYTDKQIRYFHSDYFKNKKK